MIYARSRVRATDFAEENNFLVVLWITLCIYKNHRWALDDCAPAREAKPTYFKNVQAFGLINQLSLIIYYCFEKQFDLGAPARTANQIHLIKLRVLSSNQISFLVFLYYL